MLGDAVALGDLVDKYTWTKDIESWTVAVVQGRSAADVVRIYGGDPDASVGDYYFAQMSDLRGPGTPDPLQFHLQVLTHHRYVVALENDGYSGSLPEIARRCSAGGQYFSVQWNIHAAGMLTQAINGKVTAHFQSLYPIAPDEPQPGEIRPPWAVGPETEVDMVWPTCLALLEQQTGLAVDPRWLTETRPTYQIPDPHWMLRDVENAELP